MGRVEATAGEVLLESALALPPDEREAFLVDRCSQGALLEDLLFAARAVAAAPTVMRPPLLDLAAAVLPMVDRYEVLDELGRGGMGEVYLARQVWTGQEVALKVVSFLGHAGPALRRFRREIRVLGELRHDAIVKIFDAGMEEDGRPWFAMEYIPDAVTLDRWLAQMPREPRAILMLFVRLCLGVEAAHAEGVTHRDLKPENVLVTTEGHPKLIDFGIAQDDSRETEGITGAGVPPGTLAYMSPEALIGDSRLAEYQVSRDVYALGVMLYEALAGSLPHIVDGCTAETAARRKGSLPRPLSRARPDLGRRYDVLIELALWPRVEERYSSVESLRVDIERLIARHPPQGTRPRFRRRAHLWVSMHRRLVGGVVASMGVFLIAAAVVVYQGGEANRLAARQGNFLEAIGEEAYGLRGRGSAEDHAAAIIHLSEQFFSPYEPDRYAALAVAGELVVATGEIALGTSLLAASMEGLAALDVPEMQAPVTVSLLDAFEVAREWGRVAAITEELATLLERLGPEHELVSRLRLAQAKAAVSAQDYERANSLLELLVREDSGVLSQPPFVQAIPLLRAKVKLGLGVGDVAQDAKVAIEAARRYGSEYDALDARAVQVEVLLGASDAEGAARLREALLSESEGILRAPDMLLLKLLNEQAWYYANRNEDEDALQLLPRCLESARLVGNQGHGQVLTAHALEATYIVRNMRPGNVEHSFKLLEKADRLQQAAGDPPVFAKILGRLYCARQRWGEAVEPLSRAFPATAAQLPIENIERRLVQTNYAMALLKTGRYAEGFPLARELVEYLSQHEELDNAAMSWLKLGNKIEPGKSPAEDELIPQWVHDYHADRLTWPETPAELQVYMGAAHAWRSAAVAEQRFVFADLVPDPRKRDFESGNEVRIPMEEGSITVVSAATNALGPVWKMMESWSLMFSGSGCTWEFSSPIHGFYTYVGGVDLTVREVSMHLYSDSERVAVLVVPLSEDDITSKGLGFHSPHPINRIELKIDGIDIVSIGTYNGLAADEEGLGSKQYPPREDGQMRYRERVVGVTPYDFALTTEPPSGR